MRNDCFIFDLNFSLRGLICELKNQEHSLTYKTQKPENHKLNDRVQLYEKDNSQK